MNDASYGARADDFSLADTHELDDGLSDELHARVKGELEPGERLFWAARSTPPVEPRGMGFYLTCLLACGFLGIGLVLISPPAAVQHVRDGSETVLGLVLVAIAALCVFALITGWNARRKERRRLLNTCYAVTDRRGIVWTPEPSLKAIRVQTLGRGQVRNLVRIERPDGSGDLDFSGMREDLEFGYYHRFVFAHIPEVRRVEQIVRNNLMASERM